MAAWFELICERCGLTRLCSFTPWLAKEENLAELAKALELPGLELVRTEQSVEEYAADIVARIPETDHIILIENQLERSDHSHLGQLLTYAAGTEAVAIVWVRVRISVAATELH